MDANATMPRFRGAKFTCPFCQVYATQTWIDDGSVNSYFRGLERDFFLNYRGKVTSLRQDYIKEYLDSFHSRMARMETQYFWGRYSIAFCESCEEGSLWLNEEESMVYPRRGPVALPNSDLPDEIKKDYEEAAGVVEQSPRAAAALLRLALEQLCQILGQKGTRLDDSIKNMMAKGLLNRNLQQAFDIVRVTGNNAVHPGKIDLRDDKKTVYQLFKLINIIADRMISDDKTVSEIYENLPNGQKRENQDRGN